MFVGRSWALQVDDGGKRVGVVKGYIVTYNNGKRKEKKKEC